MNGKLWHLILRLGSKAPARFLYGGAWRFAKLFKPRFHCILAVTLRCNYYGLCEYCHLSDLGFPELYPGDIPLEESIDFLRRFPPSTLDLTGGEPFLAENFGKFVSMIPEKHQIGVATNLSFEVGEFAGILGKFNHITASYHPSAVELEDFLEKVKLVRSINPKVKINMVAYPPLIPHLKHYVKTFEKNGFLVHIDPYNPLSYTEQEKGLVKSLLISRRMVEFPSSEERRFCSAGTNHFAVLPNGDAYTCWYGIVCAHLMMAAGEREVKEKYYLGNIFNGSFMLKERWTSCDIPCPSGCDLDWIKQRPSKTGEFGA